MIDTTTRPQQLQAVNQAQLSPLVRQLFDSDGVEVIDWQIEPIKYDQVNPFTIGLFRVRGTAQVSSAVKPWSMVLKIVHGPPEMPEAAWNAPDSFLYLQRESLTYRSDIRASLPECIGMPRCFEATEQAGNTYWLWIEDLRDCYPAGWPLERYALAARHLGIFNGGFLTGLTLPDYPWLIRHIQRSFVPLFANETMLQRLRDPATWEQPLIRCAFPTPIGERFLALVAKSSLLADMVDRLPQILCHHDANSANMFARCNADGQDQTILIDWSFTGINAVGNDLGQMIWADIPKLASHSAHSRFETVVFENYLAGLREAGWQGDETIVRFGYLAAAACGQGIFRMSRILGLALDEAPPANLEQAQEQLQVRELLAEWGGLIYGLMDRGEEALRLLDKVGALL